MVRLNFILKHRSTFKEENGIALEKREISNKNKTKNTFFVVEPFEATELKANPDKF
jgi:hypothetical protein